MENKEKELIKKFESLSKFIEENDIPALILIKQMKIIFQQQFPI